jgi:hypothetical protein
MFGYYDNISVKKYSRRSSDIGLSITKLSIPRYK